MNSPSKKSTDRHQALQKIHGPGIRIFRIFCSQCVILLKNLFGPGTSFAKMSYEIHPLHCEPRGNTQIIGTRTRMIL